MIAWESLHAAAVAFAEGSQPPQTPADRAEQLAREADEACAILVHQILTDLPERVLTAARAGATQVDVFRFHGKDLCEFTESKLGYVFLARGPPPSDPLFRELRARQFCTLVERLETEIAPFGVRHVWDRATHINEIRVDWK